MFSEITKKSFAILHDDPMQAEKLRILLIADGKVPDACIKIFASTSALSQDGDEHGFDVVLMGLHQNFSEGIDALQDLAHRLPKAAIIFFTDHDDPKLAARALAAGAQDIIVKGSISGTILVKTVLYAVARKQLVIDLDRTNQRLKRLNEEKNRFLGMAAHDLRGPIGNIDSFVEFILNDEGQRLGDQTGDLLRRMQRSSGVMLRLIDDLLDTSKIESGVLVLKLEPVNFSEFIKDCVDKQAPVAQRKSIEVLCDVGSQATLVIDPDRIHLAVENLISNAIKFSDPGAKVRVSMLRLEDRIEVQVEDWGQGIPDKDIKQIFDPFFRSTAKPTAGEVSTGLGLSIVKKIVDEHKGQVGVKSQVGRGTTFWFSLPYGEPGIAP